MEDGKGSNAASPAVQDAIPSVEEATMPLNSSVATPVDVSISTAHDIQDTTTTTETTPAFGGAQAFHGQEGQPPASLGGFFWEILSYVGSGMEEGKEHDPLLPAVGVATEADAKQSVDEQSPDSGKPHDARPKTPSVQRRMSFNLPNLSSVAAQTSSLVAAQTSSLVGMFGNLVGLSSPTEKSPSHKRDPSAQVFWEADDDGTDGDVIAGHRPPITFNVGKEVKNAPPILINPMLAELIRPHLPPLLREASTWKLTYSLDRHGISMQTMYRNCENEKSPALIVLKDTEGRVFGAFASEPLHVRTGFYGNGSCFLWSRQPSGDVSVFKASGINEYLILCEPHFVAFGGGEGRFGLWLSEDLDHGHSEPCQTFQNERLSTSADFHISSLEVYSFEM